jgi:hypothetical protein
VTVAVHVRRGDDALPDNPDYYTGNEAILRTMTCVKSILDAHKVKYRIRAYSRGDRADFAELSLPGVEFFLDADAIWTLQEMIEADVLIMAKGYFSYYAGLISDGIRICEPTTISADDLPGWRRPRVSTTGNWLTSNADGSFDTAAFERQLGLLCSSKTMDAIGASSGGCESEI